MEKNDFSASVLVKHSAKQICWYRNHGFTSVPSNVNDNVRKGEEFQRWIANMFKKYGPVFEERKSTFVVNGAPQLTISASHDIITNKFVMEVKSFNPNISQGDWFLKSSIVQAALYKSILMATNGETVTPIFRIKEGYELQNQYLRVNSDIPYLLWFGDTIYAIRVLNSDMILQYFIQKARASMNYELANRWETYISPFKMMYDVLSSYFTVEKIIS